MKKKIMMAFICSMGLAMGLLSLSACSMLSPVKVEPPTRYQLNKLPDYLPKKAHHRGILLVTNTEASPIYDTTRMVYTIRPYQVAYFSKNEWAAPPSQMFTTLLIQTLEKTRRFSAIITPPFSGRYDYLLNTEIETLNQDFTRRPPHLVMTVRAQLLNVHTGRSKTKSFTVTMPIHQGTPDGGAWAANQASARILAEIADFCNGR